jgi:putative aldouronate transport system permease protein
MQDSFKEKGINFMNERHKGKAMIFPVVNYVLFIIIALVMIYPLWYVVVGSLMTNNEFINTTIPLFPKNPTLEAYTELIRLYDFKKPYMITLFVITFGTLCSLVVQTMGAYALSKKFLPGRNIIMYIITFTMIFSGGLIPTYLVVNELHLVNTPFALFIPGLINTMYLLIMKTYFSTLPDGMEEAAKIDGCGDFQILVRIVIPISKSIIAAMVLFYAVDRWNDLSSGITYITNQDLVPLQVKLQKILYVNPPASAPVTGSIPILQIQKMAAIVITMAPILCAYPFLQKYFVKGAMIGSIKG